MKIQIDFGNPVLDAEQIRQLTTNDLDNFYAENEEIDRLNLFFMLLTSLHRCEDNKERELAAHLCYLMAYYLFVPLTPPGSADLALHYINKAVAYHDLPQYREERELILAGN